MTTSNVKKSPRYFRRSRPSFPSSGADPSPDASRGLRVSPTVESRRVSEEQTRSPERRLVSPTVESRRVSTEQPRSPEWRRVSPTVDSRRVSTGQDQSPEWRRVSPSIKSRRFSTEQPRSPERRLVSPTVESRRVSTEQLRSMERRRVSPIVDSRRVSTEQSRSPERRKSTVNRPERADLLEMPGPAFLDRLSGPLSTAAVRTTRPCGLGRGRYSSKVTTCWYLPLTITNYRYVV